MTKLMNEWNKVIYSGDLRDYTYPNNLECCDLLRFLKQVSTNKKIHLTDAMNWRMPVPAPGYDMYIVCAFGEFINESFMDKIDNTLSNIVLITSQYFTNAPYKNTRVFYVEHLHTIKRFFTKKPYTKLADRSTIHGSLSNRNALHKTILTAKLLDKFDSYNYTFCNNATNEYDIDTLEKDLSNYYPFLNLSEKEIDLINFLHNNPKKVGGEDWGTDNAIYQDCQVLWTTESVFLSRKNAPTAYMTEKIIKTIISGAAFVLVSQRDSIHRLESMGFKSVFDSSYDSLPDDKRFEEIFKLINNFNLPDAQNIVDYNYNYFWGDFYSNVEKNNQPLIKTVLDYING
jgi:hypothetical protein